MARANTLAGRRKGRVRFKLRKRAGLLPRLSVFRSSKHIYAQIIADNDSHTLAAASSLDQELRADGTGSDAEAARRVGELIAKRAIAAGIEEVIFDRGGYHYHGRVKALAEAAREGGLAF